MTRKWDLKEFSLRTRIFSLSFGEIPLGRDFPRLGPKRDFLWSLNRPNDKIMTLCWAKVAPSRTIIIGSICNWSPFGYILATPWRPQVPPLWPHQASCQFQSCPKSGYGSMRKINWGCFPPQSLHGFPAAIGAKNWRLTPPIECQSILHPPLEGHLRESCWEIARSQQESVIILPFIYWFTKPIIPFGKSRENPIFSHSTSV